MFAKKIQFALGLFFLTHQIEAQEKKLLFIGIDGCNIAALNVAICPNLDMLIQNGVHTLDGLTLYPTWSGNGWSTMLTGVRHDKHLVTDNSFSTTDFNTYPDFLSRIEQFNPELNTYSVVHWSPINGSIIQNIDEEITFATDAEVRTEAVSILQNEDPDVLFVDFDDVDHTGHQYGFDFAIPEYLSSIETTDAYVGEILNALTSRANYINEDWLIMVTTDHGGNMQGHGLGTAEERRIFTTCYNNNLPAQQISPIAISNAAIMTTAHFDNNQYAVAGIPDQYAFGANQDFTIEFWIKSNEGFNGDPAIISNKDWNSGLNEGFVISGQSGSVWEVNIGDGNNRADILGGRITSSWMHIAVSFDRDGLMKAYENGGLVGLADISSIGNINSGLPLVIMQDGTTNYSYHFNGHVKDIRIWNSVIEQDVLTSWATLTVDDSHPNYVSLLSNWLFNFENGILVPDLGITPTDAVLSADISWDNNEELLVVYDYANVPKEEDNAVTALQWFCIPIDDSWNLDGRSIIDLCDNAVKDPDPIEISAFPNPTNGKLHLNTLANLEEIIVLDCLGRPCYTAYQTREIDLSKLSDGLYFIMATSINQRYIAHCNLIH